jgi:hypothetical protein
MSADIFGCKYGPAPGLVPKASATLSPYSLSNYQNAPCFLVSKAAPKRRPCRGISWFRTASGRSLSSLSQTGPCARPWSRDSKCTFRRSVLKALEERADRQLQSPALGRLSPCPRRTGAPEGRSKRAEPRRYDFGSVGQGRRRRLSLSTYRHACPVSTGRQAH